MSNLTDMAKKLIVGVIILFFAIAAGAFVFFRGDIYGFIEFALGLFLGSLCACMRVVSMDITVRKSVESGKSGVVAFLLRYVFTVVVVAAAALIDIFNLWATVAGLLSLQVAAYIVPLVSKEE
ncbi:MAG: hypothetical protein FWD98_01960 [Defluviitaleaceae bacterium]|nr:hypothetical protein [Defluviitaleaceae bacterium]